jgi:GNAT superfamily N-acetyltransferase
MTADAPHCVTLDAALRTAEPARFARLLAAFAAGYAAQFHGDEAESPTLWDARIAGLPAPQPLMRVVVAEDAAGVCGGAAAELYRASGAVLLTYLYVADRPGARRRGLARTMLQAALAACAALAPVRAVLAEVEWPALLPRSRFDEAAVAAARDRLGFFERMGAHACNFDYVQPALGAGAAPVPWLRLMTLPSLAAGAEDGLRATLLAFLDEFHAALAQQAGRSADAALLAQQRAAVAAAQPLTQPLT